MLPVDNNGFVINCHEMRLLDVQSSTEENGFELNSVGSVPYFRAKLEEKMYSSSQKRKLHRCIYHFPLVARFQALGL
jgi:hypothetical protein